MPGAYAHLTLVNQACAPSNLESIKGLQRKHIPYILRHLKYCDLGCVSPDYPYLSLADGSSKEWADFMHYENTSSVISNGVNHVRKLSGLKREKVFSWLLGYVAYVVTDMTIHPVVEKIVGPYEENQKAHRICEMHQDVYIFDKLLNLGNELGHTEYTDKLQECSDQYSKDKIDPDIKKAWMYMLRKANQQGFVSNRPDIDSWHSNFRFIMDNIASEGNKLFAFARHMASKAGVVYPAYENIDNTYIRNLETPCGNCDYDELFETAIRNVSHYWGIIASGVFDNNKDYIYAIGDWNLDTGIDTRSGKLVMWEEVA
ncbi:zinc dependent phospholipase C family protein [Kangiella shandongensis]|uniref:zinc dependent phospholipase C family protein n=1 Tax=Kangiella shandongensis TaxID=2763258 RepID=UPI001CBEC6A4|nr:zinc dependent phospholipase C family protein [Kangiella shandongensis]